MKIIKSTLVSMGAAALLFSGSAFSFSLDTITDTVKDAATAASTETVVDAATTPTEEVTYQNKTYGFSFTIPAGWQKQSGEPDSNSVLFMQQPISNSCSFQFHITSMGANFPAEAGVKASLNSAKADTNKYISAKRRDDKGTRGWEIVEKGAEGGHQRIIYQVYDAKNNYYNLMSAANTENFETCRPDLRKIIDSIKFGE